MRKCNNIKDCHKLEVIGEDNSAIRVYCSECGAQTRIGKDKNGNPNNWDVGIWFKRDYLQAPSTLFYKYAGAKGVNVV